MTPWLSYLTQGALLGGAAAAQPGPFQAYLLSQVLSAGWRHTLPAAFAPLISDGPIIALMLFVLSRTPDWFLAALQLIGGFFLLYLAWLTLRAVRAAASTEAAPAPTSGRQSVLRAAMMNALSPGPYIFWGTIGGPIVVSGWRESPWYGVSFFLGFYPALIGVLNLIIMLGATVGSISPRVNRALGAFSTAALALFGVYQIGQGINALAGKLTAL